MSTINFCNRTEKAKSSRTKLNNIDLKISVKDFKSNVSNSIGLPPWDFDIVYCGRCLKEEESLELCGMNPGCTVYALKKQPVEKQQDPEPVSRHQVVTAVQSALLCPGYRTTVERMLSDRDALENIFASVPGLDKDLAVLGMLHSPELLASLLHPDNIHKVLAKHPSFGPAAMIVAAAVNEDAVKADSSAIAMTRTDNYSLDQMSDDEDVMSGQSSQAGNMHAGATGASQGITASQLSAALAMATGRSSSSSQAAQSTSGSSISNTTPMITSDFFRQAMQQATQQVGAGSTSSDSESPERDIQGQLQQLREMGIEDENVARRALEATGGDLLAALNLIFADENM